MKNILIILAACAAFACIVRLLQAPAPRMGNDCRLSIRACVIFWKQGNKEMMGGGTMPCDAAKKYVARRNKEKGAATHWYRPIYVNQIIDTERACMSPEEIEAARHGVPAKKAFPAVRP